MSTHKDCTHKDHVGDRLLPLSDFYRTKRIKSGYTSACKTCTKRQQKSYMQTDAGKASASNTYQQRKDHAITTVGKWQQANKAKVNAASKTYRENNAEQRFESGKKWRDKNKALSCFLANQRRARKIQATPPWADVDAMKSLYKECDRLTNETGIPHHVHHIVPLQELDFVCGLHCQQNLKILPINEHNELHSSLSNIIESWG